MHKQYQYLDMQQYPHISVFENGAVSDIAAGTRFSERMFYRTTLCFSTEDMDETEKTRVLEFWFGPLSDWDRGADTVSAYRFNFWWHTCDDQQVRDQFTDLLHSVAADQTTPPSTEQHQSRRELAEQVLSRVIVLSQFSRHVLPRCSLGNPGISHEYDASARKLSDWSISEGLHLELRHYEKSFLYMPFVQSEVWCTVVRQQFYL